MKKKVGRRVFVFFFFSSILVFYEPIEYVEQPVYSHSYAQYKMNVKKRRERPKLKENGFV